MTQESPFLPDNGEDSPPKTENELFQLMQDTAEDIHLATTTPDQWPNFIILLLWFLETDDQNTPTFENLLHTIIERINDRLATGSWY